MTRTSSRAVKGGNPGEYRKVVVIMEGRFCRAVLERFASACSGSDGLTGRPSRARSESSSGVSSGALWPLTPLEDSLRARLGQPNRNALNTAQREADAL